uniref:Tenascin XB n=1 Tax=Jaculus jaculus TaxID=51337 RepID=A0A8C5NX71_JACJA
MMPAQGPLTASLAVLVLLGTVRAGPFSPRSNGTLSSPRPPPQPGGPSSQLYEHTVEGGEKQVVFTHRINLPPSAGCGCPPGTEPPAPASEVQALKVRLEVLEELVKGLKDHCTGGGCCPVAAQAGTGQTDVRSLCSLHGVFDLSRCACSCEPGWGGPTCSDPADAGTPTFSPSAAPGSSCPDECNDQGRCVRGRCVCFPGYTGPSCGWPSCPGDCRGRGRCVQGACVCRAGFSGPDCSQRACPRGCSQRGRCEDGRCVCNPGYTGEDCGVRSCPRGCSQRGRCENGRCVCNPGYTGEDCSQRACPRGCSQRGRCEDGRCVCDPGYTGEDCGVRSCPRDCGEGGRCVDGRCVCWPGYAGEDCGVRTCPRDCRGRGRCEDGECICDAGYSGDDCGVRSCPGDCHQRGRCEDGRCVCWPGYTGPDCGARACPRDCRGRGRCEDGVCVCQAGFTGEDCGVRSCPGDCRGRGRCESGRCVCWPGYTGRDCGTRACPGDCRGRGRCVDGRCVCNPGFTGEDCGSHRCPGDCRGHGRCEDGVCVCDEGYSGEDCGVRRCPRDCNQRGVCQDGVCTCWAGYEGLDCGVLTCPADCHRRGRCEDGRCVCDPGYTGPACATRTCPADCRGRGRCVQGTCMCHAGYKPPASACPGGCGPRELCRGGQCVCVEGFHGPDCAIQTCPRDCLGKGECLQGRCVCQEGYAGEDCGEAFPVPFSWAEVPAIESMRMQLLEETTVRTEWTRAPGPVDAYEIQFIPVTEGVSPPFTARVSSSASAYDQRGLAPGQDYQVTVRALRGTSWGPPISKTITTMIDGPQDLRVVAVTPTTLDLSWLRPQAEVDRFVVSYVSAGNQRVRLEVPPEADRTQLTDLMPGVEYVVTVTAERGRAVSYPASVRANTGSLPSGLLGATDEPLPSGPSTTQGAQAPILTLERHPQELGELKVLGRDKTGRLRVAWTAQPDTFAHFQLRLQVAEGPQAHEELLPGDVRQALVPPPPPGAPYQLFLHGIPPGGKPLAPITYQGIMDRAEEQPGKPSAPPRLGELTVRDLTSDSLLLHWTVPEGEFDSFVIQYKDKDGPQVIPVEGPQRSAPIASLEPGRKYKFVLYGLVGKKRHGPLVAEVKTAPQSAPSPETPPRLGELWVTDPTPDSLHLSWTVPEGQFDSFMVQYRDRDGRPHVVPVEGPERSVTVSTLDPSHKYRFTLFGIANKKRYGPLAADGTTGEWLSPRPPCDLCLPSVHVLTGPPSKWLTPVSWLCSQAEGQPASPPVLHKAQKVCHTRVVPDFPNSALRPPPQPACSAPGSLLSFTAPEKEEETPHPETQEQPLLGELTVTGVTPDSLHLSWTVAQGPFDSFVVQYKDAQGQPQAVPVVGDENEVTVPGLESNRKYKMNLYGLRGRQRVGPVSVVAKTGESQPHTSPSPSPAGPGPSPLSLQLPASYCQLHSFLLVGASAGHLTSLCPYSLLSSGAHDAPQGSVDETLSPTEPGTKATEPPEKPRLGAVTVTEATTDSLSLSWTVPEGQFDHFLVQYRNGDGQPKAVRVPGHEDQVTIPGLEPDHKYKMNLYGFHSGQRVGPVSAIGAPQPSEEPLLGVLTVTGSSPDSLSLSWTVPQGHFDSFTIQYKDRDGQPQVARVDGQEREATVGELEPGRKYKMHLYGLREGQRVGPVSTVGVTEVTSPATEPPLEPRLGELTVEGMTPNSVSLSWTVPEGQFDSFVVQYKDRDGQPQVVPVDADQREVTVPDLEPARKYKMNFYGLYGRQRVGPLSVVAMTAHCPSRTSAMLCLLILDPLPPAPATESSKFSPEPRLGNLTVTDVTPDSVGLSWTVPEGEFDSFMVQYKDRDGQPQVVPVAGDQREVIVPGLEPSKKYKFLCGSAFCTNLPSLSAARGDASPGAPPRLGELWVTEPTTDSLRLSWTVPKGHFDSFMVQFKDKGGPQVVPIEGRERTATIRPLDAGRKYKFLLYGLLGKKRFGPLTADGTTGEALPQQGPEQQAPAKPRLGDELQVTDVTQDSVGLMWTVPEGQFDSFVIQYKDKDGQPQVVPVEGSLREARVSGLDPARRYKLLLYGLHSGKRVGPLSAVAVTAPREIAEAGTESPTHAAVEPRLRELTLEEATPQSLHLSWITEGEFDSFEVQYADRDGQLQVVSARGDQSDITLTGLEADRRYLVTLYGFHDGHRVGPVEIEVTGRIQRPATSLRSLPTLSLFPCSAPQEEEEPSEPPTMAPKPRLGALTVTDATRDSLSFSWHEPSEPPTMAPKPRLGALTVTESTPDSLSLSWTVPEGQFDHFLVQYRNGDGQPKAVRVPGHEDQVTIPGLEPDHKYKMNLYGFHSGQRVGPVSAIGVTAAEEETPTEPSTEAPQPSEEPLLGELTVTGSSPDSLSLSWTVPQGHFDSFTIQYKDRDGQPQVARVDGQEREATVGELEPGRKYKMHLYGLREGQRRVGPVSTVGVTDEDLTCPCAATQHEATTTHVPPEKPRLGALTVTDATSNSLSLSWTVPEGQFDHFLVQYRNGDGQPKAVRVPGHEDQATVGELEPGRKYKMHLYGLREGQRVGPVSTVGMTGFRVSSMKPGRNDSMSRGWKSPLGQHKVDNSNKRVCQTLCSLFFMASLCKCFIMWELMVEQASPVLLRVCPAPEEEATTTPVMPTTTLEPPPQKPRLGALTVTDATADSLSLSWTVPEGQFDHFLVQYKNGDGQPKAVRVPGHEDQVTIPGLEPDHKYKMNLYGFHSGQRVGPVSAIGVTEEETPTEPSMEAPQPSEEPLLGELTVTGSSPDSLSLSWTVPQGHFDSFTIQYKDRDGRPQVVRVDGLEREATVGELEPGRKYKMHLYGLREGQRVGPVSTVGVTASQPTQPPMEQRLGELSVAEVTSDTVGLSWTVAQGPFDSFLVQYKDAQGQPQAVPVSGDGREVTLWGLDPARKYKFLLFGLHAGKRHGPVSVDARTLPDTKPPPRLGELTVKDVTPDSVGLSWTVPEGEFDSFLVQYKDRDGQPQVVPVTADQHGVIVPGLEPNKKYKFLLYGLAGRKRLGPVSAEGTTAPLERTPPPRLGELTVTGETPDSVQLSWTVAQGPFDSFLIQYRDRGGQPHAVPVAADQQKVTVEGLEPGRKYKFLLYGLLGGKRLGPVSTVGVTGEAQASPPEAPTPSGHVASVTCQARPPASATLSCFQKESHGQQESLPKVLEEPLPWATVPGPVQCHQPHHPFFKGQHGKVRVPPLRSALTSHTAPEEDTPAPEAPRLGMLAVTEATPDSLRLSWSVARGPFDSFVVQYQDTEGQPQALLMDGDQDKVLISGLEPSTSYNFSLYGLHAGKQCVPAFTVIPAPAPVLISPVLESPRDLQFSDIGETSAKVNWVPPPSRVDSFKVSYQLADGGEPQSVLVDGRTQSQILQGLSPDTRYEVTVVSVRGFEESEPLTGFLTTVPDGPTQLRALNLTEGSALLHWKPPQNPVDKYNVRVAAPGAPPLQASAPGSAVDYPLRDLVLHTNYTATVRGLRGPNLTSPASITFTTGLKAPQDLEAKEVTPRTALLTWTEPQVPPTGYLLSFDTPGGQTQEILLPAGSTSQRLRGLFPSTFYNARLQAVWGESLTPPVSTSFTTGGLRIPFPRDCGEEMQNGVSTSKTTTIFLNGNRERPLDVFCDMETDGGGWLVFQRRMDGQTDFWRDWEEYAHGFGNISREFWLGNEVLHSLTQAGDYSMRVDLRAGDEAVFAQYDSFRVDSAAEYYRLHLAGYHGTAGDSMSYHSGSVFSARDRDPNNLLISCAVSYRGAWWYRNCHYANLNGLYGSTVDHQGVSWYHWKGFEFSVPFTEMKLRPRRYEAPSGGG